MPAARIHPGQGFEQSDFPVQCRVMREDVAIVQASVTGITVTVRRYRKSTGIVSTTLAAQAVTVSTSVFDTMQNWSTDAIGYNFAYIIPAAAFPGPDLYGIVFEFTPADGGSEFPVVIKANMLSLQGAV